MRSFGGRHLKASSDRKTTHITLVNKAGHLTPSTSTTMTGYTTASFAKRVAVRS